MTAPESDFDYTPTSVVYRAFDADDNLLYVGVTRDPAQRFGFHEYQTPWWHEVDRVEVSQKFTYRRTAEDAEALAISTGEPLYNRHYPMVPPSALSIELEFSPYEYKPRVNFPAVMRRIDSGSLVLPCTVADVMQNLATGNAQIGGES